jgi:hypothetical protein
MTYDIFDTTHDDDSHAVIGALLGRQDEEPEPDQESTQGNVAPNEGRSTEPQPTETAVTMAFIHDLTGR